MRVSKSVPAGNASSPLRAARAEALLRHIKKYSTECRLNAWTFRTLREEYGIAKGQAETAVDDLVTSKQLVVEVRHGEIVLVPIVDGGPAQ